MAKTLPANEKVWITIMNSNGNKFFITSDVMRTRYYIYDGDFNKLGSGVNPLELEKKYTKTVQN